MMLSYIRSQFCSASVYRTAGISKTNVKEENNILYFFPGSAFDFVYLKAAVQIMRILFLAHTSRNKD